MSAKKNSKRRTRESRAAVQRPAARAPAPSAVRPTAQRYREMFDVLAEGVLMVSATGKVLAANPSALAILGMTGSQISGALHKDRFWRAVKEDHTPFPPDAYPIRKTLHTGKPQKSVVIGIRLPRKGLRWLSVNTQPVFVGRTAKLAAVVASFIDITRQKQAEDERARLAAAIQASPDAITSIDRNSKYVSWNPGAERLFGYAAREALGRTPGWTIADSKQQELPEIRQRVLDGELVLGWETERKHKNGEQIFVESSYAPTRNARGEIDGIVGVHRDVSPLKRMLMQIESSKELFRLALNGIPDVFLIYDSELRVQFVNERGAEFFGHGSSDVVGRRDEELLPAEATQTYLPLLKRARATRVTQSQELTFSLRGRPFSFSATYVPMVDDSGEIRQILGLLHDFTQRRQTEERLSFMAQYDSLTGLPNRYLLLDRLEAAIQRAKRNSTLLGVMLLDIDRFKHINDSRGHTAGDLLLRQIAERLSRSLRASDTVARLGGDEFTVLVENATHVDEVTGIAEKIKNAFATPFHTDAGEIFTTTSVGITIYPFDEQSREGLLKNADVAMYHAKHERNTWQLYRPEMNANAARRLDMEIELRHALVRGEFELHYMPQVALATGKVVGMEALIRWHNKTLGHVAPVDFIPLAEETGLIVPIGEWVLRTACAQCKVWERAGLTPITVSVNIAAPQFRRGNLPQLVQSVLTEHQLDARWLGLEITESNIMRNAEQTVQSLTELRELGVSIAIDDFGTGYSSLSYLKRFPVTTIKIDRSFVRDISSDPNDAAIVSAIIAMCKQLGVRAVAEGVESEAQLAFLSRLACDEYQGYYFSKPLPAAEVSRLFPLRRAQTATNA